MPKHQLICGYHSVRLALKRPEQINRIYFTKEPLSSKLTELHELAIQNEIPIERSSINTLNKKTNNERHQGCLAEIIAPTQSLSLIDDLYAIHQDKLLLLLIDRLEDPRNLGACLRTAEALGVHAVIVSERKVVKLTPISRKIASGAAEILPFIPVKNISQTIKTLKQKNIWCIASSLEGSHQASDIPPDRALALLIGHEEKGIQDNHSKLCDYSIKLPMLGIVESLNVSVATGILLYAIQQQRTITTQ